MSDDITGTATEHPGTDDGDNAPQAPAKPKRKPTPKEYILWQIRFGTQAKGDWSDVVSPKWTHLIDAKAWLVNPSRVWRYGATLSSAPKDVITVVEGGCYWLEITGLGEGDPGCTIYWATSAKGNGFSLDDFDSSYGSEDVVIGRDLAFCLNIGLNQAPGL